MRAMEILGRAMEMERSDDILACMFAVGCCWVLLGLVASVERMKRVREKERLR